MNPAEIVVAVLAAIGLLCVVSTLLLAAWIVIAGDRVPLYDEPATLDVQNHQGDSGPVAR